IPHGLLRSCHPALIRVDSAGREPTTMSRLTAEPGRSETYRIVVAARPIGATIGRYRGFPIPERVVDQFGRFFTYVGVIDRRGDGQYDVDALKPGEFIVEPGIVYGLEAGSRGSAAAPQPSAPRTDRQALLQLATALVLFFSGAMAVQLFLQLLHML